MKAAGPGGDLGFAGNTSQTNLWTSEPVGSQPTGPRHPPSCFQGCLCTEQCNKHNLPNAHHEMHTRTKIFASYALGHQERSKASLGMNRTPHICSGVPEPSEETASQGRLEETLQKQCLCTMCTMQYPDTTNPAAWEEPLGLTCRDAKSENTVPPASLVLPAGLCKACQMAEEAGQSCDSSIQPPAAACSKQ